MLWSPDGDWIVYRTGTTDNNRDIYARRIGPDTATIAVSALPNIDEQAPALSPDGRWLAYVSNEAGEYEVWVRPFPDLHLGSRRVSPGGRALEPARSDDGAELFFQTDEARVSLEISDGAEAGVAARRQDRVRRDSTPESGQPRVSRPLHECPWLSSNTLPWLRSSRRGGPRLRRHSARRLVQRGRDAEFHAGHREGKVSEGLPRTRRLASRARKQQDRCAERPTNEVRTQRIHGSIQTVPGHSER